MTAPEDDGELMLRYARGDLQAFERLYARHRTALYRYLARHTRNAAAADDLFQEVWSRIITSRERYQPRAQFRTFLFRIAHNCFIDHCRRAATRMEDATDAQAIAEESLAAPESDAPDRHAEHAETLARYRAALRSLPAEQRDVFLLYEESGLAIAEIAAISGVGVETAKSRLRYALAKLRAALTAHAPQGLRQDAALEEPGT